MSVRLRRGAKSESACWVSHGQHQDSWDIVTSYYLLSHCTYDPLTGLMLQEPPAQSADPKAAAPNATTALTQNPNPL